MDELDRLAQRLEQKHHARLEAMTRAALQAQRPAPRFQWLSAAWMRPAFATAFVLAASITLWVAYQTGKRASDAPALAQLPTWVEDTQVPLTLLENMDFYDWFAQLPPEQQAQIQGYLVLADNQRLEFGVGGGYPTADLAERFFGRPAADGDLQR